MGDLLLAQAQNNSSLVDAYLGHYETRDSALFWAFEEIGEITRTDPERGWDLTLRLIARAPNPMFLSYVAAGPLEELLTHHGSAVIDRVELAARRDPKFRLALCDVWGTSRVAGDIFDRVRRAVGSGSNFQWSSPA
jgi:hypothetical protein